MNNNISTIIITYNPNKSVLLKLINTCLEAVQHVIIVDNGSSENLAFVLNGRSDRLIYIGLDQNYGIAKAQNVGIIKAKEFNSYAVILFDQDSNPTLETIEKLIVTSDNLISSYKRIACVGPQYYELRRGIKIPFVRVEGVGLKRISCSPDCGWVQVDRLIASGSLIPMSTIDSVGLMKEELFIDYVDLEWCERALSKGFQAFGDCSSLMEHSLGDDPIFFLGRAYPSHSPLRHYYTFRNAIWMYRQNYVRLNWKIVDGMRLVRKYVFYSLLAKPRHQHFLMMTKGIFHGFRGKMGKYNSR